MQSTPEVLRPPSPSRHPRQKIPSGTRSAPKNEFHHCTMQNNENKRLSGISLSHMWSPMCMSKSGPTLHRMSRHGYQPIRAHASQRDECEETALHLLSCPTLHPLRVQFAIVDDVPLMKLCFSKRLAQFFIAAEWNYAMPQTSQPRNPTQPTSPSVSPPSHIRTVNTLDYGRLDRVVCKRLLPQTQEARKTNRSSLSPIKFEKKADLVTGFWTAKRE
ncbi:Tbingi protein [Trypanosoma theileri]|uniref:Tbingi protein n=1 Tax=Trypanosoma theileri TaxID=67003 RepID=A0A1X0NF44_9TRYP|nr:Tbingi protein [Trypanosoma theileri]ORC83336.1 Tbingi protein [Trypanosoma theileri]